MSNSYENQQIIKILEKKEALSQLASRIFECKDKEKKKKLEKLYLKIMESQ